MHGEPTARAFHQMECRKAALATAPCMCGQRHVPAVSETGKYLVREGLRMESASGTGEVGQQKLVAGCVTAGGVSWRHQGRPGARTGSAPP